MTITRENILHIAKLAHVGVDEAEIEKLRTQLSSILAYVGKLSELDLTKVEPTAHVTGVYNVMREDVVKDCDKTVRDALLAAAPAREGDYVKVKAVFG